MNTAYTRSSFSIWKLSLHSLLVLAILLGSLSSSIAVRADEEHQEEDEERTFQLYLDAWSVPNSWREVEERGTVYSRWLVNFTLTRWAGTERGIRVGWAKTEWTAEHKQPAEPRDHLGIGTTIPFIVDCSAFVSGADLEVRQFTVPGEQLRAIMPEECEAAEEEFACDEADLNEARHLLREYKRVIRQREYHERERHRPRGGVPLQRHHLNMVDELSQRLGEIHARYLELREKIEAGCDVTLPDLGATPRDLPCAKHINWYRSLSPAEQRRLPDRYTTMPCWVQHMKRKSFENAELSFEEAERIYRECVDTFVCHPVVSLLPPAGLKCAFCWAQEQFAEGMGHLYDWGALNPPPRASFSTNLSCSGGDIVTHPLRPQSILRVLGETRIEQLAEEAFNAGRLQLSYTEAWQSEYERYWVAEEAGEVEAMVRQAQAMVEYSETIVDAARAHAQKSREFYQLALPEFVAAVDAMVAELGFKGMIAEGRAAAGDAGLTEEQRETLRAFEVPEAEIQELGRRMLAVTPEDLEAGLEELKAWVAELEAQPDAPDEAQEVLAALHLQSLSRELLQEAERRRQPEALAYQWLIEDPAAPGLLPGPSPLEVRVAERLAPLLGCPELAGCQPWASAQAEGGEFGLASCASLIGYPDEPSAREREAGRLVLTIASLASLRSADGEVLFPSVANGLRPFLLSVQGAAVDDDPQTIDRLTEFIDMLVEQDVEARERRQGGR